EADVGGDGLGEARERLVRLEIGPGGQRPLAERQARVADDEGVARALLDAEALAGGAPAERGVEREVVRVERLETAATFLAGEMLAETLHGPLRLGLGVVNVGDMQDALADIQALLDGLGDAAS